MSVAPQMKATEGKIPSSRGRDPVHSVFIVHNLGCEVVDIEVGAVNIFSSGPCLIQIRRHGGEFGLELPDKGIMLLPIHVWALPITAEKHYPKPAGRPRGLLAENLYREAKAQEGIELKLAHPSLTWDEIMKIVNFAPTLDGKRTCSNVRSKRTLFRMARREYEARAGDPEYLERIQEFRTRAVFKAKRTQSQRPKE
jgi:hypothetical protein